MTVQTDAAEMDRVEEVADAVEDEFGPIDVWVNCAMTFVFSEVREVDAEDTAESPR